MTIANLAKMMNVSEADVAAFVECLRVWLAKGYTLEGAIAKHMDQMARMAENAHGIKDHPEFAYMAGAVWDEMRAA